MASIVFVCPSLSNHHNFYFEFEFFVWALFLHMNNNATENHFHQNNTFYNYFTLLSFISHWNYSHRKSTKFSTHKFFILEITPDNQPNSILLKLNWVGKKKINPIQSNLINFNWIGLYNRQNSTQSRLLTPLLPDI